MGVGQLGEALGRQSVGGDVTRDARESVAMLMALAIGIFLVASLIALFVLALNGVEVGDIWGALFALATAILGALGGWLAGTAKRPPADETRNR